MSRSALRTGAASLVATALAVLGYCWIWTNFKPTVFSHTRSDFSCFYRAGRMAADGNASRVYDLAAERQYDQQLGTSVVDGLGHSSSLPFVFPPYSLALLAPLSRLPYPAAELCWYLINVAMLLALPFVLWKGAVQQAGAFAAALLAPVLFLPVMLALMQGQPSVLLLLLFAVVFRALMQGKDVRAGMALVVVTLKPQLALPMLMALLVWRKWRALAAFVWTAAALAAVSVAIVGWRAVWEYPRALMKFNQLAGSLGGEHPQSMPNLRGCIYLIWHNRLSIEAIAVLTAALSLLLLAALAILLKKRVAVSPAAFSLTIVVTLMVSYHAYLHDDSLLLLPVFLMTQQMQRDRWTTIRVALTSAMFLVPVLPISLSATAVGMFAVMALLSTVLALDLCNQIKGHASTENPPASVWPGWGKRNLTPTP